MAAVAAHMRDAGMGSIVLMASDQVFAGKEIHRLRGYQGGVAQLAKSLSVELSPLGIRVNAVVSGHGQTPLTDVIFENVGQQSFDGDADRAWLPRRRRFPWSDRRSRRNRQRGIFLEPARARFYDRRARAG